MGEWRGTQRTCFENVCPRCQLMRGTTRLGRPGSEAAEEQRPCWRAVRFEHVAEIGR